MKISDKMDDMLKKTASCISWVIIGVCAFAILSRMLDKVFQ